MIQCERVELLNIAWVRVESCGAGGGQKVLNKRIWEGNIGATKDPLSVTFTWKESAAAGYKSNFKLQNHLFEEENNWPCFLRLATFEFQTTKQFQTLHDIQRPSPFKPSLRNMYTMLPLFTCWVIHVPQGARFDILSIGRHKHCSQHSNCIWTMSVSQFNTFG